MKAKSIQLSLPEATTGQTRSLFWPFKQPRQGQAVTESKIQLWALLDDSAPRGLSFPVWGMDAWWPERDRRREWTQSRLGIHQFRLRARHLDPSLPCLGPLTHWATVQPLNRGVRGVGQLPLCDPPQSPACASACPSAQKTPSRGAAGAGGKGKGRGGGSEHGWGHRAGRACGREDTVCACWGLMSQVNPAVPGCAPSSPSALRGPECPEGETLRPGQRVE